MKKRDQDIGKSENKKQFTSRMYVENNIPFIIIIFILCHNL